MSDLIQPSVFNQKNRKARKQHQCCECYSEISSGEEYQFTSGIWDGEPSSYKICLSCVELRDDYHDKTGEQAGFGYLKETISEACFCMGYGAVEYIKDYPEMSGQLRKLFKVR